MIRHLLTAALIGVAAPALAAAPLPSAAPAPAAADSAIPAQLDAKARDDYRFVFAAIRAADWSSAAARLDALPDGLLTPIARAELFLAKNSPKVEADALVALLTQAPDLPEAAQLAGLARKRGVEALPALPAENELRRMPAAPRRRSATSIRADAAAMTLGAQVLPLIKDDRPSDAEALLLAAEPMLSPEAQTEWQQRIAWSYFLTGDDVSARRLADRARAATGEWAVQADWVAGLAAWRQKDYDAATQAFANVAARARDTEMTAAGLFWAARADLASGHPEKVQARLRTASRLPETFYGLLAGGALGQALPRRRTAPASCPPTGRSSRSATTSASPPPSARSARTALPTPSSAIRPASARRAIMRRCSTSLPGSTCPRRRSGSHKTARRAPACRSMRATPRHRGAPAAAGVSTGRWFSPTRCRNCSSARTRSARPARAACSSCSPPPRS